MMWGDRYDHNAATFGLNLIEVMSTLDPTDTQVSFQKFSEAYQATIRGY